MATSQVSREAKASLVRVTGLAARDLERVWRTLDLTDAISVRDVLLEVLPALGSKYGDAAATIAADWYDSLRAQSRARGSFSASAALPDSTARLEATARWGLSPMFGPNPTPDTALTLLQGGLQRFVADAHRETITSAIVADPAKAGWTRVGVGECDWCQQYIDGEVHYVAGYDFPAHDNCNCTAVPSWG